MCNDSVEFFDSWLCDSICLGFLNVFFDSLVFVKGLMVRTLTSSKFMVLSKRIF
jgi:hypothetical protein